MRNTFFTLFGAILAIFAIGCSGGGGSTSDSIFEGPFIDDPVSDAVEEDAELPEEDVISEQVDLTLTWEDSDGNPICVSGSWSNAENPVFNYDTGKTTFKLNVSFWIMNLTEENNPLSIKMDFYFSLGDFEINEDVDQFLGDWDLDFHPDEPDYPNFWADGETQCNLHLEFELDGLPSGVEAHYLLVRLDPNDVVLEINEENNDGYFDIPYFFEAEFTTELDGSDEIIIPGEEVDLGMDQEEPSLEEDQFEVEVVTEEVEIFENDVDFDTDSPFEGDLEENEFDEDLDTNDVSIVVMPDRPIEGGFSQVDPGEVEINADSEVNPDGAEAEIDSNLGVTDSDLGLVFEDISLDSGYSPADTAGVEEAGMGSSTFTPYDVEFPVFIP